MKHKGSQCDYTADRDADLLRAYKEVISVRDNIGYSEIIARLAKSPSSRFWVSEKRAYDVICGLLRGKKLCHNMYTTRKAMFMEIFRRFKIYQKEHPSLTKKEIIWHVCNEEAPSFYLTPKSIEVTLNRVRREDKRKCYEQRKRKVQYIFGTL
jgi:hypothetical protein